VTVQRVAAGRPRSSEKDTAILQAALQLLASHGFTRMTLDQVAAAAGVSKSTIHLRWRTKADLVTAALESMRQAAPRALTGDTRADLVGLLRDFAAVLARVRGMPMIGTCLAEEAHTPELLQLLRERTVLPRRELLLEVLAAAAGRGELREGVDPEVVASALLGSFYADYLAGRFAVDEPGAPGWAESCVDVVLAGATH
jgi:AcrR family transcriptional regulator